jgi:membrane protein YdbS with pleckstrin-like domain
VSQAGRGVTRWVYQGVWGVLARWFRVPAEPPAAPGGGDARTVRAFQPAPGFLRYLKLQFWVALAAVDLAIVVGLLVLRANTAVGLWVAPLALAVAVVPDVLAYVAIHLRYDTTWYVLTDRSLRIRRGVLTIDETTITFENVQNVSVSSGPLERVFGLSNVVVETAGATVTTGAHGERHASARQGRIEGIDDAPAIRELILSRVKRSSSAGLGDERADDGAPRPPHWSPDHLAILRDIRDDLGRKPASRHVQV